MVFTSYEFVFVFLPAVLLLVLGASYVGQRTVAKFLLFISSLVFYAWWNPRCVALLLALIGFNYGVGRWLVRTRVEARRPQLRRAVLVFGIAVNVGTLMYFKYTNFIAAEL